MEAESLNQIESKLADLGERYQPDLVLVQFCINDLNDPTLHFDAQTRLAMGSIPDAAFPDPARKLSAPDTSSGDGCRGMRLCSLIANALRSGEDSPLDAATRRATFAPVADLRRRVEAEWIARQYGEMSREARRIGAEARARRCGPGLRSHDTPRRLKSPSEQSTAFRARR